MRKPFANCHQSKWLRDWRGEPEASSGAEAVERARTLERRNGVRLARNPGKPDGGGLACRNRRRKLQSFILLFLFFQKFFDVGNDLLRRYSELLKKRFGVVAVVELFF